MYEFHIVIVQVQDSTCLFQCMNRSRLSLRFSIFLLFFLARHHLTLHALKVLKNFLRLLNSRLIWRSGNSFYKVHVCQIFLILWHVMWKQFFNLRVWQVERGKVGDGCLKLLLIDVFSIVYVSFLELPNECGECLFSANYHLSSYFWKHELNAWEVEYFFKILVIVF